MSTIDDGVIKYDTSDYTETAPLKALEYNEIEKWRNKLYELKLIGQYLPEEIGYGNLSFKKDYKDRFKSSLPQFIISGTQTGGKKQLKGHDYTRVLSYDLKKNLIKVEGPIKASSEALTHAAVYVANSKINCVFHIHSKPIWQKMIEQEYDFTSKEIPYGTLEMANSVKSIVGNKGQGILAMAGHEEGVISYASNPTQAFKLILEVYNKFIS